MSLLHGCRIATFCLGMLMPLAANSQSPQLFLEGALHAGGDDVPTEAMLGRRPNNHVNAGGGLGVAIGLVIPVSDRYELISTLGIQLSVSGNMFDYISGTDTVSWTMRTISLLGAYRDDEWRYGAGLVFHQNPNLQNVDGLDSVEWKFENAVGYRFTIEKDFDQAYLICVYATVIEYEKAGDKSVSGNSLGIGIRFLLGG